MKYFRIVSGLTAAVATLMVATQLTGCAVAVVGGAASVGTLIATSGGRRDSETAQADSRIENQANEAIQKALEGSNTHVVVASYYRKVLLAGEVPTEADRSRAQAAAQGVEGVRGVVNDLAVMPASSVFSRSQDGYITSKVNARLFATNGVPAASVKVLTVRGTVYVMGRLTRLETQVTTDAIQQVDGVQRVARVIDIIPDEGGSDGAANPATGQGTSAMNAAAEAQAAPGVQVHPVESADIQQSTQPIQAKPLPPLKK